MVEPLPRWARPTGCASTSSIVVTSLSDGDVDGELWAAWQALSARAAKPNPFCHPALVIPWLEQLPRRDRRVLLAWRREADKTPTLVGALPIVFEGLRYR